MYTYGCQKALNCVLNRSGSLNPYFDKQGSAFDSESEREPPKPEIEIVSQKSRGDEAKG